MDLKTLVEEIRRIFYIRNIDSELREVLVSIVENAWQNVEEGQVSRG